MGRNSLTPFVSVVVCTYNRADLLRTCLESLVAQTADKSLYEVIVINNNSTDTTQDIAEEFAKSYPNFRVVTETRQGLSFAKNRGIKEAKGDLLFFLDDDAIVDSKSLALYRIYYEDMGFRCMGGKILPWFRDNSCKLPCWLNKTNWGALSMLDQGDMVKRVLYPEFPYGGNLAVAKYIFEEFGFFNEDMGRRGNSLNSGEEMEFMLRLERAGIPIYYVPDAKIYHLVQKERLTKIFFFKRFYAQGTSDAYMFSLNTITASTFRHFLQRLLELALSPINYIIKKIKNIPDYFIPIFRISYNLGYLIETIKLIIQRKINSSQPKSHDVLISD